MRDSRDIPFRAFRPPDPVFPTLAAAGPPAEVLTPALLREVYGVDADVLTHPRTGRPVIALAGRA